MNLKGKRILVTGASRGIGKAIAIAYVNAGADVIITGRSYQRLKGILKELNDLRGNISGLEWDIAKVNEVNEKFAEAVAEYGTLDIIVNNAGVISRDPFLAVTEENWDLVLDTNLKGLYFLSQAAANYFIKNEIKGKIINIASDAGLRGAAVPYGISKWGVVGLTKGMAKQLFPRGIIVNAIAPGPVTTEMMNWHEGKPVKNNSPFGRMAFPEEIAELAVFLASNNSARIAGEVIAINGNL